MIVYIFLILLACVFIINVTPNNKDYEVCEHCCGSGEFEVEVMGTDTNYIKCEYCNGTGLKNNKTDE